jgi:hypothetical protein
MREPVAFKSELELYLDLESFKLDETKAVT